MQQTIRKGKPFTDVDFVANQSSLLDSENDNGGLDKHMVAFFKTLVWRRLSDIYKDAQDGMEMFKKGIEPGDVRQGKLSDCYFLSALSALAEVPGRIESLFNTKTVNQAGIYSINFNVNGYRQEVIVDDFIPCDP